MADRVSSRSVKSAEEIELMRWTAKTLHLGRPVFGLPAPLGWMQAAFCELLPGKPFTLDNRRSLKLDSVSDRNDLMRLGIKPRRFEPIVAQYLAGNSKHQRKLSQYRRLARR